MNKKKKILTILGTFLNRVVGCSSINLSKNLSYKSVLANKSKSINTSPSKGKSEGSNNNNQPAPFPQGSGVWTKGIINIISYTFLVVIIYFFIWDLRISDFFQIFIFSIFSFAISIFISDKFKLSNNKFIKILQKLVFTNIILALFGLIGYLLDISIFNLIFCADDDFEVATKGQEAQISTSNKTEVQSSLKEKEDLVHITSNTEDKEYYNFKIKKKVIDNVWVLRNKRYRFNFVGC